MTISEYSKSLKPIFQKEEILTIHSVFDNSINLVRNNRLISLVHKNTTLTPMSIRLSITPTQFKRMNVSQGDTITIDTLGLRIKSLFFSLKEKNEVDFSYLEYNYDHDHFITFVNDVERLLLSPKARGHMSSALKHLLLNQTLEESLLSKKMVTHLKPLINPRNTQAIIDTIPKLVGLGEGLTPSGDDFISGLLSALHYLSKHPKIKDLKNSVIKETINVLDHTTTISKEYLQYAIDGLFNTHVKELYTHHWHHKPYETSLENLNTIGHSSGTDFIIGLYIGLKIGGNIYDS